MTSMTHHDLTLLPTFAALGDNLLTEALPDSRELGRAHFVLHKLANFRSKLTELILKCQQ